mmetsp:Transcript_17895/g.54736  ORF Transcript_17895/g.54736 Transcript_17895/m.54736 type:complete len:160 (-) Transcript_17895:1431-1910(-)
MPLPPSLYLGMPKNLVYATVVNGYSQPLDGGGKLTYFCEICGVNGTSRAAHEATMGHAVTLRMKSILAPDKPRTDDGAPHGSGKRRRADDDEEDGGPRRRCRPAVAAAADGNGEDGAASSSSRRERSCRPATIRQEGSSSSFSSANFDSASLSSSKSPS